MTGKGSRARYCTQIRPKVKKKKSVLGRVVAGRQPQGPRRAREGRELAEGVRDAPLFVRRDCFEGPCR